MYNGGRVTDLSGTTSWAKRSGTRFNSRTVLRSENPIGAYNGHRRQMSISQFPGWKFARICKPPVRINCRRFNVFRLAIDAAGAVTARCHFDNRFWWTKGGGGNRSTEERLKSAIKRFLLHHAMIVLFRDRLEIFIFEIFFRVHSFVGQFIISNIFMIR